MNRERHIIFQNTTDILDPNQKEGCRGRVASLILHLLARSLHMASSEDLVVAGKVPDDFIGYLRRIRDEECPPIVQVDVQPPLFTAHLLGPLENVLGRENYCLNPYIQWETVAAWGKEHGIQMAFTNPDLILGGIVRRANDKIEFRRRCVELGIPIVPSQEWYLVSPGREEEIKRTISAMAKEFGGVFVQNGLSGGGVGNVAIRCSREGFLVDGRIFTEEELGLYLRKWLSAARGENIAVAPFLELIASHTVSGFIPPLGKGEPFVYGLFEQVLDPQTHDYRGFKWPAFHEQQGDMIKWTIRWFSHLQQEGYVGPSDVDFILGKNPKLGTVLAASESNTRWDAFRFALSYAARKMGWDKRTLEGINPGNAPAIYQEDHVRTRLPSTSAIVKAVREGEIPLFGIEGSSGGVIVMVPPRKLEKGGYETALAVVGENAKEAERIFSQTKEAIE